MNKSDISINKEIVMYRIIYQAVRFIRRPARLANQYNNIAHTAGALPNPK